jgi:hypothetical protein
VRPRTTIARQIAQTESRSQQFPSKTAVYRSILPESCAVNRHPPIQRRNSSIVWSERSRQSRGAVFRRNILFHPCSSTGTIIWVSFDEVVIEMVRYPRCAVAAVSDYQRVDFISFAVGGLQGEAFFSGIYSCFFYAKMRLHVFSRCKT